MALRLVLKDPQDIQVLQAFNNGVWLFDVLFQDKA